MANVLKTGIPLPSRKDFVTHNEVEPESKRTVIEATSDMGDFMSFLGLLRRLAVKLSKIAHDLRLLSSGPHGHLYDVSLPAMQPGSSIMPGKVNPVIPEAVSQTAFQDLAMPTTKTSTPLGLISLETYPQDAEFR